MKGLDLEVVLQADAPLKVNFVGLWVIFVYYSNGFINFLWMLHQIIMNSNKVKLVAD